MGALAHMTEDLSVIPPSRRRNADCGDLRLYFGNARICLCVTFITAFRGRLYHGRHQVAPTNQEFFEAGVGSMTENGRADEQLPVIARFEVRHRSYLAPDGSIHRRPPSFPPHTRLLVRLYPALGLVRAFVPR